MTAHHLLPPPTAAATVEPAMTTATGIPQTVTGDAMPAHPGHRLVLEPVDDARFAAACACGGFLEPEGDTEAAQRVHYETHLSQTAD